MKIPSKLDWQFQRSLKYLRKQICTDGHRPWPVDLNIVKPLQTENMRILPAQAVHRLTYVDTLANVSDHHFKEQASTTKANCLLEALNNVSLQWVSAILF